jgi:predicted ATPase with chaperone activity
MKANNGTLLIDDFGRQVMRPQDLLNRWMIPMEKHVDYLMMATGQTIELPLNIMLIFSTNLRPADLLDEAYLRRLRYRIPMSNPSPEQFRRIFQVVCNKVGLEYDPEMVDYLLQTWYDNQGIEMRACHPRDIVAHMLDICRYEDIAPRLTPGLIDQACALYFTGHPQADASMRPRLGGAAVE